MKTVSSTIAAPISSADGPELAWVIAEPPSVSTATIANFERISAISVSMARMAHTRRAGHTIAAKNSGSMRAITSTAAPRMSSSSQSAIVAATVTIAA